MSQWLLIYLLCNIFLLGNTQFLERNEWRAIRFKQDSRIKRKTNPFYVSQQTGVARFQRQDNRVSIALVSANYNQCYYLFGTANKTIIKIAFHTFEPQSFGKVYGYYKIKIKRNIDDHYKTKTAFIKYWPNRKISITIRQYNITVSAKEFQVNYAVFISICLTGIKILLLAVLLRRKRWEQMSDKFLFVIAGWQFKCQCVLWHYYFVPQEQLSASFFLLVVLTIKSLKVVIECSRISNKILGDWIMTVSWMLCALTTLFIAPFWLIHALLPCMFKLQLKKYNIYSKLDFEVHYCFVNLNLILSFELVFRAFSLDSQTLGQNLLVIYTILSFAVYYLLVEYYQYSQSSNKSPLCVQSAPTNQSLCPYCREGLYQYQKRIVPESESQFVFEKWRFDVIDCGHILHQKCFQQMKNLKRNCPLLFQGVKTIQENKVE